MLERVQKRFAIKPKRLIVDTYDGSAEMLRWLVKKRVLSHMCGMGER